MTVPERVATVAFGSNRQSSQGSLTCVAHAAFMVAVSSLKTTVSLWRLSSAPLGLPSVRCESSVMGMVMLPRNEPMPAEAR